MTWGTIGMMLSFLPSTVLNRFGEGITTWCGAACCTVAYCLFAVGWSGAFDVSGWRLYTLAFIVGQSTAFVKMAALSLAVRTLGTSKHNGKCISLLFACLEFGACMYAQITEIWCVWGCAMWGKASVAIRHAPMTIVAILMGYIMRKIERVELKVDPRVTYKLSWMYVGLLTFFFLAAINWFGQTSWCHETLFEWTGQLMRGDFSGVGITILNCWIPTFMLLAWTFILLLLLIAFFFNEEVTSAVIKLIGAFQYVFSIEESSARQKTHLSSPKSPDDADDSHISSACNEVSKVSNRYSFYYILVITGMTLGIGQGIGNSYWTISAMYAADKPGHGGIMKIAGTYLLSRMLGSVVAGFLWDADRHMKFHELIIEGLGFSRSNISGHSQKHRTAESPLPYRHKVLRPFVVLMMASQIIFAVGWTKGWKSDVTVFTGFAFCGLSTGAMNALIPILTAHHYGPESFCKSFSYLMLGAIMFQIIFYNGIENGLYWINYGKHDSETVLVYTDDLDFRDYPNWGGCNMRRACYQASFWIQAGSLLLPTYLCDLLEREENVQQYSQTALSVSRDDTENVSEIPEEATSLLGGNTVVGRTPCSGGILGAGSAQMEEIDQLEP